MSATKSPRFTSLDVFRGITIFLMILVNTAGPGAPAYTQLVHAKWIGFTLADAIFPSFLFAMGNAMCFALARPVAAGPYVARLLKRGAVIFVLGYLMYWFPFVAKTDHGWVMKPFDQTRVPGVLQRLALCYVFAGLIVRWLDWRRVALVAVALVLAYWAILLHFSAPGMAFDKYANAGTRLDLFLLPPGHLYKKDFGFDPEGLLGTMPAVANVLAGYLAGLAIRHGGAGQSGLGAGVLGRMAGVGAGLIALGLAWSPWFPIAKKLWSGSFVAVTVGIDLIALAALVWLIEIRKVTAGQRFFLILGRNPLAIYLFSELFVTVLNMIPLGPYPGLYDALGIGVFQAIAPGAFGSFLCALAYTMACWAVGWAMDRKGLILKA